MSKRGRKRGVTPVIQRAADPPVLTGDRAMSIDPSADRSMAVEGRVETFQGPLPHPDHYAHYERTLPGAANRILQIAERQSAHRLDQEKEELRANIAARSRGQWFGFVIALAAMGLGAYLSIAGLRVFGGVVLFAMLADWAVAMYTRLRRLSSPPSDGSTSDGVPPPPATGPQQRGK